jgi:hypothetical protein
MSAVAGRWRTSSAGTARRSVESGAHLDAGRRLTRALVDAVAQGQVPAVLPVQVEYVGIGEALGLVPVGEGVAADRAVLAGLGRLLGRAAGSVETVCRDSCTAIARCGRRSSTGARHSPRCLASEPASLVRVAP